MKRKREETPESPNKEIKGSIDKIHYLPQENNEQQISFDILLNDMKAGNMEDFGFALDVLKKGLKNVPLDPTCQFKKILFNNEDGEKFVYYGMHKNEKRHGLGICVYENRYYDGCWNNGMEHVYGVLTYFKDGIIVKGEWRNSYITNGTIICKKNGVTTSEYRGGLNMIHPDRIFYNGKGMLRINTSNKTLFYYIGVFKNGAFKEGALVGNLDFSVVLGKFNVNNEKLMPVGEMTVRYFNNLEKYYIGELDKYFNYHGKGTLYLGSGEETKYVGHFKEGDYDGYGTIYSKDGSKYEGDWRVGLRHGYGIMHLPKDRYEGGFKDGMYDGYGVFYCENGDVYDGMWKNNTLNGNAVITSKNGWIFEGGFEDGKKSNKGCWNFYDGKTRKFNKDCLYIEDVGEKGERYAIHKYKKEENYVYELELREGKATQSFELTGVEELKKLIPMLNKVERIVSDEEIEKFKCKVCCYKDVEILFSPCNHLFTCEDCSFKIKECPVCRKTIEKKIKVFV
jgi:hypothetical protein